jgi:CBS domain-containing protein
MMMGFIFFMAVFYVFLSSITYYIALPTDNVIPNLIIGAVAGRLCAIVINVINAKLSLDQVDPGAFALLGSAAYWAGTSRLVLTVIVITMELTGDFDYLPAIVVASFSAAWIASALGESLYHIEMHNHGAPYLHPTASHHLKTITTDVMMTKNLVTFRRIETIQHIKMVLSLVPYEGFPVVEHVEFDEDGPEGEMDSVRKVKAVGYVRRERMKQLLGDLEASGHQDEDVVEIESICTSLPFSVIMDTTASKVFQMFRLMGLKHVFVTDRNGFLEGMVTRRDLLRHEEGEWCMHLHDDDDDDHDHHHHDHDGHDSHGDGKHGKIQRFFNRVHRDENNLGKETAEEFKMFALHLSETAKQQHHDRDVTLGKRPRGPGGVSDLYLRGSGRAGEEMTTVAAVAVPRTMPAGRVRLM